MKTMIAIALALSSITATAQDKWTGQDKAMHFGVSYALGFAAGNQWPNKEDRWKAIGVAMIPGVLKEVSDAQKGGTGFSGKDIVADLIGASLGVYSAHWLIGRQGGKTTLAYRTEF